MATVHSDITTGSVEITQAEWRDYIRLQRLAKQHKLTLFDILREIGTLDIPVTER